MFNLLTWLFLLKVFFVSSSDKLTSYVSQNILESQVGVPYFSYIEDEAWKADKHSMKETAAKLLTDSKAVNGQDNNDFSISDNTRLAARGIFNPSDAISPMDDYFNKVGIKETDPLYIRNLNTRNNVLNLYNHLNVFKYKQITDDNLCTCTAREDRVDGGFTHWRPGLDYDLPTLDQATKDKRVLNENQKLHFKSYCTDGGWVDRMRYDGESLIRSTPSQDEKIIDNVKSSNGETSDEDSLNFIDLAINGFRQVTFVSNLANPSKMRGIIGGHTYTILGRYITQSYSCVLNYIVTKLDSMLGTGLATIINAIVSALGSSYDAVTKNNQCEDKLPYLADPDHPQTVMGLSVDGNLWDDDIFTAFATYYMSPPFMFWGLLSSTFLQNWFLPLKQMRKSGVLGLADMRKISVFGIDSTSPAIEKAYTPFAAEDLLDPSYIGPDGSSVKYNGWSKAAHTAMMFAEGIRNNHLLHGNPVQTPSTTGLYGFVGKKETQRFAVIMPAGAKKKMHVEIIASFESIIVNGNDYYIEFCNGMQMAKSKTYGEQVPADKMPEFESTSFLSVTAGGGLGAIEGVNKGFQLYVEGGIILKIPMGMSILLAIPGSISFSGLLQVNLAIDYDVVGALGACGGFHTFLVPWCVAKTAGEVFGFKDPGDIIGALFGGVTRSKFSVDLGVGMGADQSVVPMSKSDGKYPKMTNANHVRKSAIIGTKGAAKVSGADIKIHEADSEELPPRKPTEDPGIYIGAAAYISDKNSKRKAARKAATQASLKRVRAKKLKATVKFKLPLKKAQQTKARWAKVKYMNPKLKKGVKLRPAKKLTKASTKQLSKAKKLKKGKKPIIKKAKFLKAGFGAKSCYTMRFEFPNDKKSFLNTKTWKKENCPDGWETEGIATVAEEGVSACPVEKDTPQMKLRCVSEINHMWNNNKCEECPTDTYSGIMEKECYPAFNAAGFTKQHCDTFEQMYWDAGKCHPAGKNEVVNTKGEKKTLPLQHRKDTYKIQYVTPTEWDACYARGNGLGYNFEYVNYQFDEFQHDTDGYYIQLPKPLVKLTPPPVIKINDDLTPSDKLYLKNMIRADLVAMMQINCQHSIVNHVETSALYGHAGVPELCKTHADKIISGGGRRRLGESHRRRLNIPTKFSTTEWRPLRPGLNSAGAEIEASIIGKETVFPKNCDPITICAKNYIRNNADICTHVDDGKYYNEVTPDKGLESEPIQCHKGTFLNSDTVALRQIWDDMTYNDKEFLDKNKIIA